MSTFELTQKGSVALVGAASIVPAGPPMTYLGISRQFANALGPLAQAGAPCALSLAIICAHTLECALKAYLSRSGDDTSVKQAKIRHNILALWEQAAKEGLDLPTPTPPWVTRLSALHNKPYHLRCSTGVHAMVSPGAEPMRSDIERVVTLVGAALTA